MERDPRVSVPELGFPLLRVRLFSTMDVRGPDGANLLPKGRKTRGVLAVLALNAGRPVRRDELTELLWSRREREQARASLRQAVHELGDLLGGMDPALFLVDRTHLSLGNAPASRSLSELVQVDIQALSRGGVSRPEALELFRPTLVEDLAGIDPAFDRWRAAQTEILSGLARVRAEAWLAACQTAGADGTDAGMETLVRAAELLIAIDRAHEGAWRVLIRVHAARGDRAAAVSTYERCADALAAVAQLAPSEETASILSSIRNRGSAEVFSDIRSVRPGPPADQAKTSQVPGLAPVSVGYRPVRIGVMPLRMLDASQTDELSLGVAEEITYTLSRLSWLSCVAPSSMSALAQQNAVGQVGGGGAWRLLGLDLLLEGTVQRGRGRARVMIRLLDLHAGEEVIWARRFDRQETDLLTLQEEIAAETVAQLDPELLVREGEKARSLPRDGASADHLLLRAIPAIYRLELEGFHDAGEMLAAAIVLDPTHASAHAWYAYWHLLLVGQGWAEDVAAATLLGGDLAERAVRLDPTDARALTIAGHVRCFLGRHAEEGLQLHEQALAVNPHLALAWCFSGLSLSYLGRHEEAIERIAQARKLSPFDPHGFFFDMAAMMPFLMLQSYDLAIGLGNRALALNPTFSSTYKGHLAALGHLGRLTEAKNLRERLLVLEPKFCVRDAVARSPLTRPEDLLHYAEGLRLAGLAETAP